MTSALHRKLTDMNTSNDTNSATIFKTSCKNKTAAHVHKTEYK